MGFGLSNLFGGPDTHQGGFSKYKKYSRTDLERLAKKNFIHIEDRKRLRGSIEDIVKPGHKVTARQILEEVSKDEGYRFKQIVKRKLLTDKPVSGLSEAERRRNALRTKYDRLREEQEADNPYQHRVSSTSQEHKSTFFQSGSESPVQDDHHDEVRHTITPAV